MEIGFLLLKLLQFYVLKMAANGGRHFKINIKTRKHKTQFISQKHARTYSYDKCLLRKKKKKKSFYMVIS